MRGIDHGMVSSAMRDRIFLRLEIRNKLFTRAYVASGSLRGIAHTLGHRGKGRNGMIRDMWLGRRPIPEKHLQTLASLAGIDLEVIRASIVNKQENQEQRDWWPLAPTDIGRSRQ